MDIMVHAQYDLGENGMLEANLWMFAGMLFFLLLSYLIPEKDDSADSSSSKEDTTSSTDKTISSTDKTSTTDKITSTTDKPISSTDKTTSSTDKTISTTDKTTSEQAQQSQLEKMGLMTALGISLHNFPEGLVVFNATVVGVCNLPAASFSFHYLLQYLTQCTGRGLAVAMAIALHNIPEGIAVALPIYCSTHR